MPLKSSQTAINSAVRAAALNLINDPLTEANAVRIGNSYYILTNPEGVPSQLAEIKVVARELVVTPEKNADPVKFANGEEMLAFLIEQENKRLERAEARKAEAAERKAANLKKKEKEREKREAERMAAEATA